MNLRAVHGFDWDSGNWPKCGKHGLSKAEIESLFGNAPLIFPDSKHSDLEERFKAIGSNKFGRHLYVNFTLRSRNIRETLIRPISARYMHQEEIDHYEQS